MYLAQLERKRSFAEQNLAEIEELLRQGWLLQSYKAWPVVPLKGAVEHLALCLFT